MADPNPNRVSRGTSNGGRFAEKKTPEATGISLSGAAIYGHKRVRMSPEEQLEAAREDHRKWLEHRDGPSPARKAAKDAGVNYQAILALHDAEDCCTSARNNREHSRMWWSTTVEKYESVLSQMDEAPEPVRRRVEAARDVAAEELKEADRPKGPQVLPRDLHPFDSWDKMNRQPPSS